MDYDSIMEQGMLRETAALEEKLKSKMRRQIRIFNKEKSAYTRRTRYEASKQRRALAILEKERDIELDNYIATQSEAVEKKYKREETVVRDLVKTTDQVQALLSKEIEGVTALETEIANLDHQKWQHKQKTAQIDIDNNFFRIPDATKMESRIEWAGGKYHQQLHRNRELQEKIDTAIYMRDKFMKEEAKMLHQLDRLNKSVTAIMSTTADIYEQRDRAEGTKQKVKEHLAKVKDEYERELLNITLAISDDKKMEHFMRTKHKDITQYLQHKRDQELADATEMINKKDDFTEAFNVIKNATEKSDINKILMDFIEAEEDNFSIFLSIGEVLDDNEKLRSKIRDLREENVGMEERDIETFIVTDHSIKEIQTRIDSYKMKREACVKRLDEHKVTLDEFTQIIEKIIGLLELDKATLNDYLGKDGQIKDTNLLGIMTAIENQLATDMKDYYMVELSTRAVVRTKHEVNPDEKMLSRIPSFRIGPHFTPKITPSILMREKEELEDVKSAGILNHENVRDLVIKSMMVRNQSASKRGGGHSAHHKEEEHNGDPSPVGN